LTFVDIATAIAKAQEKRSERLEITLDKWLRELAIIGFSDLKDYLDISEDTGAIRAKAFKEMPEGTSRALEAIEENRAIKENSDGGSTTVYDKIKFKMHDKLGALEKIGKSLGFLKDKIDHSGEVAHTVQFIMPRPRERADKK
jgi:phage terminase small subunit